MESIPQPAFYVYVLARPNGKPFYVGKGKRYRIYEHESEARRGHNCHKCHIIRKIWKHGGEVQRYTVFTTDNEQEALDYEMELIALHGRESLANKTDGGEGTSGLMPTEATRKKLSAAQRRKWLDLDMRERHREAIKAVRSTNESRAKTRAQLLGHTVSDETRLKISQSNTGKKGSRLGHTNSPEHRRKIGEALKGRVIKPESIEKIRATLTGRKANISDEQRQRLSERMQGNKYGVGHSHNKGISPSEETRQKISETLKANSPWKGRRHTPESIEKMRQKILAAAETKTKTFECQAPDGTAHTTHNLKRFCSEHGLTYQKAQRAMRDGKLCDGWNIRKVCD